MDLADILREECINTHILAADRTSVLQEIAKSAKRCPVLSLISEQQIFHALDVREDLGSTGFEQGIAIPHCTLDSIDEFVAGVVTVPQGADFGSLDKQLTHLFVFIIGPASQTNDHIRVLATVSQVLRNKGAKDELIAQTNPVTVRESFLRYSRDAVDANAHLD